MKTKMKRFFILGLISLSVLAQDPNRKVQVTGLSCNFRDVHYVGPYHADQWSQKAEKNAMASCEARKPIDAVALENMWKINNKAILDLITQMQNEKRCQNIWDVLGLYLESTKQHKSNYSKIQIMRAQMLAEQAAKLDLQRNFAFKQMWNAHCSGQHNGKSTMIDLEMINQVLTPKEEIEKPKGSSDDSECEELRISGTDNMNKFKVSLANTKGDDFLMAYSTYSVPDQIIVKGLDGSILHDSGCIGTLGVQRVKIPMSRIGKEKIITLEIINDCERPRAEQEKGKGFSVWDLYLACQKGVLKDPCWPEKEKLAELLKLQVEYFKKFLDINDSEKECLAHMDSTILPEILKDGLIQLSKEPFENSVCENLRTPDCETYHERRAAEEKKSTAPSH